MLVTKPFWYPLASTVLTKKNISLFVFHRNNMRVNLHFWVNYLFNIKQKVSKIELCHHLFYSVTVSTSRGTI